MNKNSLILVILFLLASSSVLYAQKYTLSGHIRELGSGELLLGVNVYEPSQLIGTTSNTYGFYSLTLPKGNYNIVFSFVGYTSDTLSVNLNSNVEYDVNLRSSGKLLEEVSVVGKRYNKQSQDVQMSRIDIPIEQIKTIPSFLGEKDVMKVLQLMPGVQKGHEGSSGIYVRGGAPDQNLIILDDAVVYNANHLFGFFSLFNGDALKSVEFVKGGFPARYGGRLSSVIEMNMKDGNKEKFEGEAGIGLISSKVTLQGPIINQKSSFLVSGRRTYLDMLMKPFMTKEEKGGYYFYDMNAKVNYDFGRKNKLYISGYFGRDKFYFKGKDVFDGYVSEERSGMYWQNATGTIRWNHLFNSKLFANTSFIVTNYHLRIYSKYSSTDTTETQGELKYISSIRDFTLKSDFHYFLSPTLDFRFGVSSTLHRFIPSAVNIKIGAQASNLKPKIIHCVENGAYVESLYKRGKLQLNTSLRFSNFIRNNKIYNGLEPRVSASFVLNNWSSIKASYAYMNQYVHLLSNTGVGLPTDLWIPSTSKIKPQKSWQAALGYHADFAENNFSFSTEAYYKEMNDIISYKEGASYIFIDDLGMASELDWEESITSGFGRTYGIEFLLQRKVGKLNGWIGYTLSTVRHKFSEINNGEAFFAKHDRRHDFSIVTIYNVNPRVTLSASWVYSSGQAISMPIASYTIIKPFGDGIQMPIELVDYGKRNAHRMKPYHRLDFGVQFHKIRKNYSSTLELSVYNAYSRKNPFYYTLDNARYEDGRRETVIKQVSLFPIVPSISYVIKF
ncbi:MAG: TonB-dependent receptor [Bacteroidales bacterium]